jgi:hypothetical protein
MGGGWGLGASLAHFTVVPLFGWRGLFVCARDPALLALLIRAGRRPLHTGHGAGRARVRREA